MKKNLKIYDGKKVLSEKIIYEAHTCHREGNPMFTGRRFRYVSNPSKIDVSIANFVR